MQAGWLAGLSAFGDPYLQREKGDLGDLAARLKG